MNLPFLDIFKKWKAGASATFVAAVPVVRIEKPASERFGKTVTPNVSRGFRQGPTRDISSSSSVPNQAPARVSMPTPFAPKTVLLGAPAAAPKPTPHETFTVPAVERTIALKLAEIIPQIPRDLFQTTEIDPQQRILLNASELERGMANGRPTVLLRSIYEQAPEIFNSEVSVTDPRQVPLPFSEVLEQFVSFKVRGDQVRDLAAPQIETPFLKVTIEDSERFGTPLPPLQPAVAEPKPAAKIQPLAPIRLSVPKDPNGTTVSSSTEAPIQLDQLRARPPIALKIPPNGTGVPAIERVPASSGPPVLTPLPVPAAAPALPKISFKITDPTNDLRPPSLQANPPAPREIEPLAFSNAGARIRLSLRAVLRGIPPFQLDGPIDEVPAEAQIELPFSIIEPQLSLGRVALSPAQFQAAMPEECRRFFKLDEGGMPVPLPLPEVLQNLPNESLELRGDQEETEIAESFETPFSQKAAEDAARLRVPAGPVTKVAPPDVIAPAARSALQVALETDDALDAKSVVAHASRLPGVSACAIVFSDGLSLAGNIPADYGADALCAMAPSIVRRIDDQMTGANFGSLQGITLFCAKTPVSFFAYGNICLAALHSAGEISAGIRARLNCTAQELARMYAAPA
jgi:predicted regulator of Ras-like GTPase activity (Roadblock/LC7/MglB family)